MFTTTRSAHVDDGVISHRAVERICPYGNDRAQMRHDDPNNVDSQYYNEWKNRTTMSSSLNNTMYDNNDDDDEEEEEEDDFTPLHPWHLPEHTQHVVASLQYGSVQPHQMLFTQHSFLDRCPVHHHHHHQQQQQQQPRQQTTPPVQQQQQYEVYVPPVDNNPIQMTQPSHFVDHETIQGTDNKCMLSTNPLPQDDTNQWCVYGSSPATTSPPNCNLIDGKMGIVGNVQCRPSLRSTIPYSSVSNPVTLQTLDGIQTQYVSSEPSTHHSPLPLAPTQDACPLNYGLTDITAREMQNVLSHSSEPFMNPTLLEYTTGQNAPCPSSIRRHPKQRGRMKPPRVVPKGNLSELESQINGTIRTTGGCMNNSNNESSFPVAVRPLTPYNYFFRFERERILRKEQWRHRGEKSAQLPSNDYYDHSTLTVQNSHDFQQRMLQEQWSRPPNVKRRHRKTHGCISFRALSDRIAASWKNLPPASRDVFREIARKDRERYTSAVKNHYYHEQQHKDTLQPRQNMELASKTY